MKEFLQSVAFLVTALFVLFGISAAGTSSAEATTVVTSDTDCAGLSTQLNTNFRRYQNTSDALQSALNRMESVCPVNSELTSACQQATSDWNRALDSLVGAKNNFWNTLHQYVQTGCSAGGDKWNGLGSSLDRYYDSLLNQLQKWNFSFYIKTHCTTAGACYVYIVRSK